MASLTAPMGLGTTMGAVPALNYPTTSSQSAFVGEALRVPSATQGLSRRQRYTALRAPVTVSQQKPELPKEEGKEPSRRHLAESGVALLAAGLLLLAPGGDALAAKSGGRVGGSAFRSSGPSAPHSNPAPRAAPRINNSRTYIYSAPSFAPPVYGGGFVTPYYAPSYSIVTSGGGILSTFVFLLVASIVIGFFLR